MEIITWILMLMGPSSAWAADRSDFRPMDEVTVRNVARKRLYPGGNDEEPLKVQAQLPLLKSKSDVEQDLDEDFD